MLAAKHVRFLLASAEGSLCRAHTLRVGQAAIALASLAAGGTILVSTSHYSALGASAGSPPSIADVEAAEAS